jgi:hypothetical protein
MISHSYINTHKHVKLSFISCTGREVLLRSKMIISAEGEGLGFSMNSSISIVSHNCFYYTSKPECAISDDNLNKLSVLTVTMNPTVKQSQSRLIHKLREQSARGGGYSGEW